MISWIASKFGLQIWVVEIIIAVVAGLGIFWYIKFREARAFDQGHANGIQENIKDQLKPLQEDLERQRAEISATRESVNQDKQNLAAERKALTQLRVNLEVEHTKQLQEIRRREELSSAGISKLSDAELVAAIRLQLSRNRAVLESAGFDK